MIDQSRLTLIRQQSLAFLIAILLGMSGVPRVFAVNYTWDASGGAPLDDGSGTWASSGGTNWFNGTTYGAWGNTTSDVAFFGVGNGAAGTVTVSGSVTTNGLTFNSAGSGNYTLSGGTIGLGGTTPTIAVNAAGTTTIGSLLSGTAGMTKTGTGTLILAGTNSYTGNSSVSAGTLQFGDGGTGGTVPAGTIALSQFGNVTFNYGDNRTLTNTFTLTSGSANAGVFTQSGAGTLTLQGTQRFRAITTTAGAGSLSIGGGTLTLGRVGGSSDQFDSNITAASGAAITISGSLATSLTGGNSFLNKFGGGTLYLGNATGVAFNQLIIAGGPLDVVGTLQATLKGRRILFSGTSDPVLQASGSYTPSALGNNQNNVGWFDNASDGGFAARSAPLTVNIASGATLTYTTGSFAAGNFLASGRTLVFGSETSDDVVTLQNPLNLAGGSQSIKVIGNANPNNAAVLAGAISNGGIVKTGSGRLTLSASNSYALGTTVSDGTLAVGNASALGTGALTVNAGVLDLSGYAVTVGALSGSAGGVIRSGTSGAASLTASSSANSTFAASIADGSGVVAFTKAGSGTLTLSGSNSYTGGTQINAGVLALANAAALGSTGTISFGGGTLQFSASNTSDYSSRFSTAASQAYSIDTNGQSVTFGTALASSGGSLTKSGAGTLTLSAQNTYSGATSVTGGTLALSGGWSGTMGAVSVQGSGAALSISSGSYGLAGNSIGVGGGLGPGVVNQSGGIVTFASTGVQLLLGNIGGNGLYTLSSGTIVTAASTTRGITVGSNANQSGTFAMSGGGLNMTAATGAGGDSTLQIGRYDAPNESGQSGAFTQTGGVASVGILSIGGNSGGGAGGTQILTLTGGTFAANQFPRLSAGNSNVATITIGGSADVTLPAFPTARGTGAAATVYFDGGVLRPAAASASYMTGLTNAYIRAGGATFNVAGGSDITIGQALLQDGTSTGGGLTKAGVGTLTLTGSNTFTGNATLNAGTLNFGNLNALGSGTVSFTAAATLQSGVASGTLANAMILPGAGVTATFDSQSNSNTLSGPINGAGDLAKIGAGTLTLAGTNSYTGNSSVSAGTLQFGNGGTGGTVPSGTIALSQTGNVTFNYGDNRTLTNTFTLTSGSANAGVLTQSGAGTLTLQGTQQFRAITTTAGAGSLSIGGGTLTLGRVGGSDQFDSFITAAPGAAITISGSVATTVTSGGSFLYKYGGGTLYLGNATGVGFNQLIIAGGPLDIVGSLQATLKGRRILFSTASDQVLQASGSYTPSALGNNQNNVGWFDNASDGGFAARSGPLTVNIASGATLTFTTGSFAAGSFLASGRTLVFGSETSDDVVTFQNPLNLSGTTQTIKVIGNANPNNAAVLSGVISNGGLTKVGSGRLTLSASNSYALATTITGGRLEIASGGNVNSTSGITINGTNAELKYNSATALTKPITFTQGTLSGTGTIGTAVTAGANDILSPGNSPGAQSFTSGLTWDPAGTYLWEMNNATSGTGTGWDIINVSGGSGLVINATSGTTFRIAITSLSGTAAGNAANFSATTSGSWTILSSASGITGFAANKFTLDRSAFSNTASGTFTISQVASGTNQTLVLAYNTLSTLASSTSSVTGFRVMQSQTTTTSVNLINSGPDATGYSLSPSAALLLTSSSTGTLAASGTQAITFGYASTATTGARSGTVSFTDTGNNAVGSFTVSGAVLDNRIVTASAVNFGLVHVGGSGTATSTLTSTGSNSNFTQITVANGSGGGLTVSGSSGFVFDGSGGSSRTVAGSFGTAGAISGTISLTNASAEAAGLLPGQVPGTTSLPYSVSVFSGTATWTVAGGGSWGTGSSSNWTSTGGVGAAPGTFAGYTNTDRAIFAGSQTGTSTILLNGATPSLAALVFSNTANRYVIDQGSGGSLTLAASSGKPTIEVASGALHEIKAGILGSTGLEKLGAGSLVLSGSNGYTGATDVTAGTLAVNGSLTSASAVTVASNATLGGSGSIAGAITGAGLVSPGNSPGILTAGQFNPSAGLDAAFEFTGLAPTYTSASASVNDILRLTNSFAPFATGTFTAGNVIDVYFNVDSIANGQIYEGGFFTGLSAVDLLAALDGKASFSYWAKTTGAGTRSFGGVNYVDITTITGITGVTLQTSYGTKDFGGSVGSVTGSVTQFVIVPEPGALALAGIGVGVAGWASARRRRRAS